VARDLPRNDDARLAIAAPRLGEPQNVLSLLIAVLACMTGCGGPSAPAPRHAKGAVVVEDLTSSEDGLALLLRYPQSPALQSTRDTYAGAAAPGARDSIFMTTWFPTPDARVGEWSTVDSRGRVTIYRFVHDVGFQNSRTTSLVASQLPELQELFSTLPPSSAPQTLDRLLIVGCRRAAGDWQTRLYDRTAPPEIVKRVFREMTGAPLE
jgi:hypothetical protein